MLLDLQSFKMTDKLNLINDPAPGVSMSTSLSSGAVMVQPYDGMKGGHLTLNRTNALQLQDTATNPLYEGMYQYVKLLVTTKAVVKGNLVYWSDRENYVVTTDVAATTDSQVAGVILNPNWTTGYWGWIQVQGKATVLFGTVTKATPAIGDLVVATATSGVPDVLADATAIVSPNLKLVLGEALAAPVSAAASLVELWSLRLVW